MHHVVGIFSIKMTKVNELNYFSAMCKQASVIYIEILQYDEIENCLKWEDEFYLHVSITQFDFNSLLHYLY